MFNAIIRSIIIQIAPDINKILQLKMRLKRYEELPSQFIPKYSHKYLMRKTLVNTKFQWLMKYLSYQDQDPNKTLSQLISIKPKQAFNGKDKINRKISNTQPSQEHQGHQTLSKGENSLAPSFSNNLHRHSKSKTNTQPIEESIFIQKSKARNKSLLMQRSQSKKKPFFDKENRKTYTEKSKKSQKIERSKTDIKLCSNSLGLDRLKHIKQ